MGKAAAPAPKAMKAMKKAMKKAAAPAPKAMKAMKKAMKKKAAAAAPAPKAMKAMKKAMKKAAAAPAPKAMKAMKKAMKAKAMKATTGGAMTQTAVFQSVGEKCGLKTKDAKGVVEALMAVAVSQVKKSGSFKLAGLLNMKLKNKPA